MTTKCYQSFIPEQASGLRIDQYVAQIFPQYSRNQIQQAIKLGAVQINRLPVKCKQRIQSRQHILIDLSTITPTDVCLKIAEQSAHPVAFEILDEDEHLIIINKPAGLVMHPGAANYSDTLLNGLLYHCEQQFSLPRAGIVHRLDKDTSGILVVAKTWLAYNNLVTQLQNKHMYRGYLALAHGHVLTQKIEGSIGRHRSQRTRMCVTRHGKPALTQIIHLQYQPDTNLSLLHCKLHTGRTHQIRVHMSHIGHPIVGDPCYGKNYLAVEKQLCFERQALHAQKLHLQHPHTQATLVYNCPLPEDFKNLLHTVQIDATEHAL